MEEKEQWTKTDLWNRYERGLNFMRQRNIFTDTDRNWRFYNGNQWEGVKLDGIEPIQFNVIKPIVKYKVGAVNSNLWAINYSAENYDNEEFREVAIKTCELLNVKANKIWEKDELDHKIKRFSKQSAINDEAIFYVDYDEDENTPVNEIIQKNDIMYGNENDEDIQTQPYIIIRKRMPIESLREYAKKNGVKDEDLNKIIGDQHNHEGAGEQAKEEVNEMAYLITYMWKKDGTVHYNKSTEYVDIKENTDSGLTLYPVSHYCWEENPGDARGVGEVRHLIPNQMEINKTLMRRALTVKNIAYPQKVVNIDRIENFKDVNKVGSTLKIKGMNTEDVRGSFAITNPTQMGTDAEKLMNELVSGTRDLAGAGDAVTGQVDAEKASGRAILAVQNAAQQPLSDQVTGLKRAIEDLARIWLDMIKCYTEKELEIIEKDTDIQTGEETEEIIRVPKSVLDKLQAMVKIDITPKGAFDKYAQEMSLENMFLKGAITLEEYVSALDPDSVMPKQKLDEIVEKRKEKQQLINQMDQEAQMMKTLSGLEMENEEALAQMGISKADLQESGEEVPGEGEIDEGLQEQMMQEEQ